MSLRRKLEEARTGALTSRASEEAARLQITRMMDEQLEQKQTIDTLWRQVESSNTSAQQAQALLRANQEQQSWMPPPNTIPVEQEVLLVTLLLCRPCQLLRQDFVPGSYMVLDITTLAHGPIRVMQNICVLCLAGMRWIHQDRSHQDKSNSSQYTNPNLGWQSRPGQSVPAFPSSRIIPTRRMDTRDASMQCMLKFGSTKIPNFSEANLVNTQVHLLIQHIHQLLSQKSF